MKGDLSGKGYVAIVIAAGFSSRMGEFKPLLDIGGKPALYRLLDTIKSIGIKKIIVVTGHGRESIETALGQYKDPDIIMEHNADFESGMFSSVKAGVRFARGEKGQAASLLFPADVPLVSSETILGLISAYEKGEPFRFALPVYQGKNGHPLLIPFAYYDEILCYTGEGGLKGVRSRHDTKMLRYAVDDAGCVLDMDTPEDYENILDHYARSHNE